MCYLALLNIIILKKYISFVVLIEVFKLDSFKIIFGII